MPDLYCPKAVILESGQYICDLLDDFLDFAKLKSGACLYVYYMCTSAGTHVVL
jgi:hypothetical protein